MRRPMTARALPAAAGPGPDSWPASASRLTSFGERFSSRRNLKWVCRGSSLGHCFSGVAQGLADVFVLQVRVLGQDLLEGHAVGHHSDHGCHRETQVPDARQPTHAVGIGRDALEPHAIRVPAVWLHLTDPRCAGGQLSLELVLAVIDAPAIFDGMVTLARTAAS